jgi:hypothetical protein
MNIRTATGCAPVPSMERERRARRGGESEAEAPTPSTDVSSPRWCAPAPRREQSNAYKVLFFSSFFDLEFLRHCWLPARRRTPRLSTRSSSSACAEARTQSGQAMTCIRSIAAPPVSGQSQYYIVKPHPNGSLTEKNRYSCNNKFSTSKI